MGIQGKKGTGWVSLSASTSHGVNKMDALITEADAVINGLSGGGDIPAEGWQAVCAKCDQPWFTKTLAADCCGDKYKLRMRPKVTAPKVSSLMGQGSTYWDPAFDDPWSGYSSGYTDVGATKPRISGEGRSKHRGSMCFHVKQEVKLLNGLKIYCSSSTDSGGKLTPAEELQVGLKSEPELGFYLASSWRYSDEITTSPGVSIPGLADFGDRVHYPWRDFSIPAYMDDFVITVKWLLGQLKKGKTVEIGCVGGHGRTGTLLACLFVAQGMSPRKARRRVWSSYCKMAIENDKQEQFVSDFSEALKKGAKV